MSHDLYARPETKPPSEREIDSKKVVLGVLKASRGRQVPTTFHAAEPNAEDPFQRRGECVCVYIDFVLNKE